MDNNQSFLSGLESPDAPVQGRLNPPKRILVVDDDSNIREINTEALSQSGFHVDAAADGAAAWRALQAKQYDLLITDNSMPKVTGIELIKKLRGENPTLPVIMASSISPTQELEQHPVLAINAILLKPYTIDELLGIVKQVLRTTLGARE